MFSKIVVMLPGKKLRMNRPGMHMVAVSRIKELAGIAFISNDSNPLTYKSILSVGKSKPCNSRKNPKTMYFVHFMNLQQTKSKQLSNNSLPEIHQLFWMVTTI